MKKLTPEQIERIIDENFGFANVKEAMLFMQDEVLRINGGNDAGPVFDFTAREKAMTLASMLAGSVGMNDVHGSEGYSNDLRAHLMQFVQPRATGCPDTMDDMGRFAADELPAILRKQAP